MFDTSPILFLDDSLERVKTFISLIPSALTTVTAAETIAAIEDHVHNKKGLRYLFLDHDLGGEEHVDSAREDCGMEVVRHLCGRQYQEMIGEIVIHSQNEPAALRMLYNLQEWKYRVKRIPFIHFKELMKKGQITL